MDQLYNIEMMSAAGFHLSANQAELYVVEISELGDDSKVEEQLLQQIPKEYHDLLDVFSEKASNEVPNHSGSDMKIEFQEGQEPRNTGLRPMSLVEVEEFRRYLEENLGKGWIRRSKSPVSAPIFFA